MQRRRWVVTQPIRWAKRNRARAAAMMTGTSLDEVVGGRISVNDDSAVDSVIDWLSDVVDGVDAGAGAGSGSDGSSWSDGGGYDCGGGGGDGGYCGGD